MSKGSRKRESNEEKQRLKKEREQFEANKRKVRRVTAIIASVIILALVLVTVVASISYNIRMNKGEYLRNEVAAASHNIEVDGAMMNYFFNDVYNTFVEYYGSYVMYFGLDTTRSLRKQQFSDGESWFDYFMSGAKDGVSNILSLNEAARASGVSLSEAQTAAIKARVDNMDVGLFGRGVNKNDIFNAKLLEALAYDYQYQKESEFAPSETEIIKEYESAPERFQRIDYLTVSIPYSEDQMSEEDASDYANELAAAKDIDGFRSISKDILLVDNPDLSEEDLSVKLDSMAVSGALYTDGNSMHEWAFEAKEGQTLIVPDKENSKFDVYMLTKEAYIDQSSTVNVRHILLSDADYKNLEETKKAASELLDEFGKGTKDIESFSLLALEHSQDAGSYYKGGRYENVAKGQMVSAFEDWCFDPSRKTGDTGIVETDYGCHIMYFEEQSLEAWQASVADTIISERMNDYLEDIQKEYSVVFDNTVLDLIPD